MHDREAALVSNTTPLLALTAAMGNLDILKFLYQRVIVPIEVADEIRAGGVHHFGVDVFDAASWLEVQTKPVVLQAFLKNSLDQGEASVIQTAMDLGLPLVCIDESVGRRVARLCGLNLTGSVGLLLKAQSLGYELSIPVALKRMHDHGIWLSDRLVTFAMLRGH